MEDRMRDFEEVDVGQDIYFRTPLKKKEGGGDEEEKKEAAERQKEWVLRWRAEEEGRIARMERERKEQNEKWEELAAVFREKEQSCGMREENRKIWAPTVGEESLEGRESADTIPWEGPVGREDVNTVTKAIAPVSRLSRDPGAESSCGVDSATGRKDREGRSPAAARGGDQSPEHDQILQQVRVRMREMTLEKEATKREEARRESARRAEEELQVATEREEERRRREGEEIARQELRRLSEIREGAAALEEERRKMETARLGRAEEEALRAESVRQEIAKVEAAREEVARREAAYRAAIAAEMSGRGKQGGSLTVPTQGEGEEAKPAVGIKGERETPTPLPAPYLVGGGFRWSRKGIPAAGLPTARLPQVTKGGVT